MDWLDKLKGKIGRPQEPPAQGADTLRKPADRDAGTTVVRAGAKPGATMIVQRHRTPQVAKVTPRDGLVHANGGQVMGWVAAASV